MPVHEQQVGDAHASEMQPKRIDPEEGAFPSSSNQNLRMGACRGSAGGAPVVMAAMAVALMAFLAVGLAGFHAAARTRAVSSRVAGISTRP